MSNESKYSLKDIRRSKSPTRLLQTLTILYLVNRGMSEIFNKHNINGPEHTTEDRYEINS